MGLVIFATEFFSDMSNLLPLLFIVPVACLVVLLVRRRVGIESPLLSAFAAVVFATAAEFGVFLSIMSSSLELALNVLKSELFWTGFLLTLILAWVPVWLFAAFLRFRQDRPLTQETGTFE